MHTSRRRISWLTTRNLHAKFDTELNKQREAIELWKLTGAKLGKANDGKVIELSYTARTVNDPTASGGAFSQNT